jgi:molecular chaperone GrpE
MEWGEDQQILERLGQWLRDVRAESASENGNSQPLPEAVPAAGDFGVYQLVEAFTTLRHEVNLQTRSTRGLEDQTKALLPALAQAIDALRSVEPKETQAAWNAGKQLALALAELDEALERGHEQTERVVASLLDEPDDELLARLDELHAGQSWLSRLLHSRYFRRLRAKLAEPQPLSDRQASLEALLDGYRLIQKRLAQSLQSVGITRIRAAGQPVDPEQMIVVEVVETDDLPAETVCDEIRAGYMWKGRLLRSAEVRATRNSAEEGEPAW